MSSRAAAPLLALIATFVALTGSVDAWAQAGHREVFVTSSLHFAGSPTFAGDARGPGAGLSLFYGLTPQLSAGAQGRFTWALEARDAVVDAGAEPDDRAQGPSGVALAAVGYNFDVLVVIPFVTAGFGVVAGDGLFEQAGDVRPAAMVSIGADWRPRRTWALGLQLDNLWRIGGPGGTTPALGVSVRFSNIFEPGGL